MPKKDRTFAAKLAHETRTVRLETCGVCGKERVAVVHMASVYGETGAWRPQKRRVKVCDCNRQEVYG
jgi:hypothetical protein